MQPERVEVDLDVERLIPERRGLADRVRRSGDDGGTRTTARIDERGRAAGDETEEAAHGSRHATARPANWQQCRDGNSVVPLEEYKRKRDFKKTPEPAGSATGEAGNGAARSAAAGSSSSAIEPRGSTTTSASRSTASSSRGPCPKGPTLDAGQRRMAVHVEDHPIEYLDFEGVIPKGEYGGGDVIVWDWGTWQPEPETPDGRQAVEDGELKFTLAGEKVRGRFTIVRTSGRGGGRGAGRARAAACRSRNRGRAVAADPQARRRLGRGLGRRGPPEVVKTGRTNDEVKADRDAIWISQAPAAVAEIDLSGREDGEAPGVHPADGRDPDGQGLPRRRLALRDQVGRLPGSRPS